MVRNFIEKLDLIEAEPQRDTYRRITRRAHTVVEHLFYEA